MKAMVCQKYGTPDVLCLKDVAIPVAGDNQVLIRVHATSVTAADYRIRGLNVPTGFAFIMRLALGFRKPRRPILGINLAGEVEAVGKNVSRFKPGDQVFGSNSLAFGAYAEYVCMDEDSLLVHKPEAMSFEQAAAFSFGALSALSFLRDKGRIVKDEKVLIYGASGAVGTAAVQLAKYFGAEVTAVCSAANLEMVKSIGADTVIDYQQEDFTRNGKRYDIIFDTVGQSSFAGCLSSLSADGRYLLAVAGIPRYFHILWTKLIRKKKIIAGVADESRQDLVFLGKLFEKNMLIPVIDRSYPFEDLPAAHRYAEQGHKKGCVVISMGVE